MSERALGFLLLLPAALLLCLIVVYPIANLVWDSFFKITADPALAGGAVRRASKTTPARWRTSASGVRSGTRSLYAVITVPGALVVGMGLALLANLPFKQKWPVRLGLLLPWALPLVFAGLIFRWFFEYKQGIVNDVLVRLGVEPFQWLTEPRLAVAAICIAIVWKTSSFMALMLLAGLQTIPRSLYEAAEVDGATRWQQFLEITIPMLRPAIFVALIFRTITAIQTSTSRTR